MGGSKKKVDGKFGPQWCPLYLDIKNMKSHIPNLLTVSRIVLIPPLIAFYWYSPESYLPFALFALLAVTDFFDGYLARKWSVMSDFGAFLDPVADKLLVVSLLLTLAIERADMWFTVPALIIISRELVMSMLREWMAKIGLSRQVAVGKTGKIKTASQMGALCLFLLPMEEAALPAFILLYIAKCLTCYSLFQYLAKFPYKAKVKPVLKEKLIQHTYIS